MAFLFQVEGVGRLRSGFSVLRKMRASGCRTLTSPIIPAHASYTSSTLCGLSRLTMQEDPFKNPPQSEAEATFADYFHDPDAVADSAVAWQLESNGALLDAVRLLFPGHQCIGAIALVGLVDLGGAGQGVFEPRGAW